MEIGKQYPKDDKTDETGFLRKARLHQSKWRAEILNLPYDTYGSYLTETDARNGHNFYKGFEIFQSVNQRYPNYSKGLYANMLRSEHVPFNMFIPFKKNLEFFKQVLNKFLNNSVSSANRIEVEYAPKPAKKYLNDRTSFDAYVEFTHKDGGLGILGIEVKYTEHEYALKSGSKEETDINDPNSTYLEVTKASKLYDLNDLDKLKSDLFRQIWRNQLLGESMVISDNENYKHFTSITVFPRGNTHFVETSKAYIKLLKDKSRFLSITYEDLFEACRGFAPKEFLDWIDYMENRYLIETN